MAFDYEAYEHALEHLTYGMENITDPFEQANLDAMEPACRILRIAHLVLEYYDNPKKYAINESTIVLNYIDGEYDERREYRVKKNTNGGNIAVYRIYQRTGDEDWTSEEIQRIKSFLTMLFMYNGRVKVLNMVERLVFYDSATGIPNLTYCLKKMDEKIAQGRALEYGVCYFNLKKFGYVNDQVGRDVGTEVMSKFAHILQGMLSDDEYVGRIGGDNFVCFFKKENVEIVKDYVIGTDIVYNDSGDSVNISTRAGFYMINDSSDRTTDIMDKVSVAVGMAKNVLFRDYVFYDDKIAKNCNETKEIEKVFSEAMEKEEFKVFYQPKVELKKYGLYGAEALCRWYRNGSLVPPAKFVPQLEANGAIRFLDFYMLEHVCKDIRRWIDEGRKVVKVSVNFSRRHLSDKDLVNKIVDIIDRYNVPRKYIEVELTETINDAEYADLKRVVNGLHDKGIAISVDDFGTGYSSLSVIRDLPWSIIKIDKCFLPTEEDENDYKYTLLKHVIAMIRGMGAECIVEGVETLEQVRLLKENNCFLVQGYYFDRPLPMEEFERKLMRA